MPERDPSPNPLLIRWPGEHGLPPFAAIEAGHFEPAFEVAFAEHRAAVEAIAAQSQPPDFRNTVEAVQWADHPLRRLELLFQNLCASCSDESLREVERELIPRLAAHHQSILAHPGLFERLDALHGCRAQLDLDPVQVRLIERLHLDRIRAGARLDEAARNRCGWLVERLASLSTHFGQNLLADESAHCLVLRDPAELAGLPDFVLTAARRAAQDSGLADAWVITLARSSVESFLTFSERRDLREHAHRAWIGHGANAGPHDNRPLIPEILALRQELAQLHGQPDFAHHALADRMAGNPDAVDDLLRRVWAPACEAAARERAQLQALADRLGHRLQIEAWDWRFYADRLRREMLSVDESVLKPYLQLDRLTEAMFDCASRLFGLRFVERSDCPLPHPSVRVWQVSSRDGDAVGLFLADNFARQGKQSGAWMSNLRLQCGLSGERPIVVNSNNFSATAPGEPVLLSIDDARTLFHEFGHALHGLLSRVPYPRLQGADVAQDFVELPSQLFEHWLLEPQVLRRFARHVVTNEPMPEPMIESLRRARRFGQGFATVEYAACALLDMSLHRHPSPRSIDPDRFERDELARLGMPRSIVMRHRLAQFGHVFAGQDYAAGYYVYLWAEVLDADAFQAFVDSGDVFDPALAGRLHQFIYSAGNLRDPAQAYRLFRGRDAGVQAMLTQRGFPADDRLPPGSACASGETSV